MDAHEHGKPGGTNEPTDWEAVYEGDVPDTPVDGDVIALARDLEPGAALDLGCGSGQNSIWLAQQGWTVHGVDIAGGAIERATDAAQRAGLGTSFEKADLTTWRTSDRFDLVLSTYALPRRGPGRVHALATARDAVGPGGCAIIAEFEVSLARSGWMGEEDLVTLEEVTTMFVGFDLQRAEVKLTEHSHGEETNQMPVAIVVARRPAPPTSES